MNPHKENLLGKRNKRERRSAFTLVELLVVIAIIGILIGMLLPAVQQVREAARRTECSNKIRQLSLALLNYESAHMDFPAHRYFDTSFPGVGWQAQILPFIEQNAIGQNIDVNQQAYFWGNGSTNINEEQGMNYLDILHCPSYEVILSSSVNADGVNGVAAFNTHYVGNAGPIGANPNTGNDYATTGLTGLQGDLACQGILPFCPTSNVRGPNVDQPAVTMGMITDGTSNTFMIFEMAWKGLEENPGSFRSWVRGCNRGNDTTDSKNVKNAMRTVKFNGGLSNFNSTSMGSNHPGGCNIGYADGSVHFIEENIDLNTVMLPMASRDGGELADAMQ